MFGTKHFASLVIAAAAITAAPAQAASAIDTTAPYSVSIQPFGANGATQAYGQSFTVGGDNVLNSFSLYLNGPLSNSPLNFNAYVYAWNGSAITGSALYTSGSQNFTGSAMNQPTEFSFNTGNLALNSGQYVAFLFANSGGSSSMPISGNYNSNPYAGGQFVYANTDFANLTSEWDGANNSFGDVWFKANFAMGSAVPEPGTWGMMLLGFGVIGFSARRNRRAKASLRFA